ncbi:MAG: hypothetical protein K2N70_03610, partial [Helicobacter sp.]|nr:hypothetical protein [Helicobacter sp.]
PSEPPRLSTEELLRFTLENEIRQSQIQQRIFNQELQDQNQQIKVAQIYAKSDLWLAEKDRLEREREAQKEAELRVLARSQGAESAAALRTSGAQQEQLAAAQTQATAPAQATANVAQPAESAAISAIAPLSEQDEKDNLGNANTDSKDAKNDPTAVVGKDGEELSDEEKRIVNELASIDTKVHEHENAHLAAAGGLAQGGADYTYTEGPDGKLYATAGEVSIDTSSTGDAQKDVQKAQQIQAAAMAPADPSPQDYRVAADAAMMQMEAQMKASEELSAELRKTEGVKLYQENMDFFERERTAPRSFQAVA